MIKTGAQILWECLEQQGVTTVFGYPGGAILPAYDALKYSNIHHVLVRHEQGATHMADGYARASGRVGVAVATSGPGATNMVTGIATAMLDSSPIVCITGQVGSKLIGSDAFQETDITGVTLPVTKHNYLVTHAERGRADDQRSILCRQVPAVPGPCWWTSPRTRSSPRANSTASRSRRSCRDTVPILSPTPEEYKQALELIHNSKRPVILAGHGIILSGAMDEVRAFAEKANIPVGLTLLGLGAFPGVSSAEPGNDGHARRSLAEHDHPGSRFADRLRHAL